MDLRLSLNHIGEGKAKFLRVNKHQDLKYTFFTLYQLMY